MELLRRGLGDPDAWAQEYELEWLDGASAWLPYDLLAGVEDKRAGDPQGFAGGPAFIGNDIAARRDLWVAWVWERVGDVLWTREVRTLRRASFAAQAAALDELVERYRPVRIVMDQTGMGEAPTEAAKRRHGQRRVEGVLFTADRKQSLATLLKQHAEDRKMRIPVDAAVRADLHSLRRVTTPAGNVRFDVHGGSEGAGGGHADRAWAAALGAVCCRRAVAALHLSAGAQDGLHRAERHPRREPLGARNTVCKVFHESRVTKHESRPFNRVLRPSSGEKSRSVSRLPRRQSGDARRRQVRRLQGGMYEARENEWKEVFLNPETGITTFSESRLGSRPGIPHNSPQFVGIIRICPYCESNAPCARASAALLLSPRHP